MTLNGPDSLRRLLGFRPSAVGEVSSSGVAIELSGDVAVEDLNIDVGAVDPIQAFLVRPKRIHRRCPAILYCHAHGNRYEIGRRELLDGRPSLRQPAYGPLLASRGFVTLCMEMPTFGARAAPPESALSKQLLWQGKTLLGQMLGELSAGVDYLLSRDDVDPGRVAAMGFSMGATHAYWLAAIDPRVGAVVQLCCFADIAELVRTGAHDLHGPYLTVPGMLNHCDAGDVAGLVAPRPHLICVGLQDPLTPRPAFDSAWRRVAACSRETGAEDRLRAVVEEHAGHEETVAMRHAVIAFLERFAG